MSGNLIQT